MRNEPLLEPDRFVWDWVSFAVIALILAGLLIFTAELWLPHHL